jgi:hypothetical protein
MSFWEKGAIFIKQANHVFYFIFNQKSISKSIYCKNEWTERNLK